MGKHFVVYPKRQTKKTDESVTISIRMTRDLQDGYDQLASKSNRSRNELICMALKCALDNLEFIPDDAYDDNN